MKANSKVVVGVVAALALAGLAMGLLGRGRTQAPAQASRLSRPPVLNSLLDYLRTNGVRHCYAPAAVAAGLRTMTYGAVRCCTPWPDKGDPASERDRAAVNAATQSVYVFSTAGGSLLSAEVFEADLRTVGIMAARSVVGDFVVYDRFRDPVGAMEQAVTGAFLIVRTSHNPGAAGAAHDGQIETAWSSGVPQAVGMWIEAQYAPPQPVRRFVLASAVDQPGYNPPVVRVMRRIFGVWRPIAERVALMPEKMSFMSSHPVYTAQRFVFRCDPVDADTIRVEIVEPNPGHEWVIGEAELHWDRRGSGPPRMGW